MKKSQSKFCFLSGKRVKISLILAILMFIFAASGWMILYKRPNFEKINLKDAYKEDIDFCAWSGNDMAPKRNRIAKTAFSQPESAASEDTEGFYMENGAGIRLNTVTGIRFRARVSEELVQKVRQTENAEFGIVIAPAYYFSKALELFGPEFSDGGFDYVSALESLSGQYGARPALQMSCEPIRASSGNWVIQGSVVNILYNNTNLDYASIAYIKTGTAAGAEYRYAGYSGTELTEHARSVSYVATAALNDQTADYGEVGKELLREFVFRGIDRAANLTEEESQRQSKREIELSMAELKGILEPGTSVALTVTATVTYDKEALETGNMRTLEAYPFYWQSSDEKVAEISRTGEVTGRGEGSVTISVSIGEVSAKQEIICREKVYYTVEIRDVSGYGLLDAEPQTGRVPEGETFKTTIRIKNSEYGQLSFWLDGAFRTTEGGALEVSLTVEKDQVFEISGVSSALKHFENSTGRALMIGAERDKTKLPDKLILPEKNEEGIEFESIAKNAFCGTANSSGAKYTNLKEVWIPGNYKSMEDEDPFKNCTGLERIYLNNEALSESGNAIKWSDCKALKKIYVPVGAKEKYLANAFWSAKSECLEEYSF